jgi:hypothetical protein
MTELSWNSTEDEGDFSDWENYEFDPSFFQEGEESDDGGGFAIFKLRPRGFLFLTKKTLYLHIYNWHNGYYGHGFEMKVGDEIKHEGCL